MAFGVIQSCHDTD